jgi:hypothetical protein
VDAAPLCQQDGAFLRCAHAAAWMCHYSAVRRSLVARQKTAAFVEATPNMLSVERALPSKGMTLHQLQAVFDAFGQPALFYGLGKLPIVEGVADPQAKTDENGRRLPPGKWDTRIFSILCRYLNSGYPVFIATDDHAFVIVGWYRDGEWIRFIANDDQRGPYQVIQSPFTDERGTWQAIMVPLPPSVLLSGESVENGAYFWLRALGSSSSASQDWRQIAERVGTKAISLRTVLCSANDYKRELERRDVDPAAVRLLRLARLPRFVWIVEAHDREARASGKPCVRAEILFDSTSTDFQPRMDALLMPELCMVYPPDHGTPTGVRISSRFWTSSLPPGVQEIPDHLRQTA